LWPFNKSPDRELVKAPINKTRTGVLKWDYEVKSRGSVAGSIFVETCFRSNKGEYQLIQMQEHEKAVRNLMENKEVAS
jgi:hypothetical protein